MRVIVRVNKAFRDKPVGPVVDFIGIARNLKSALSQYSPEDQKHAGIDLAEAIAIMLKKYAVVSDMFRGFDCQTGLTGFPRELKDLVEVPSPCSKRS